MQVIPGAINLLQDGAPSWQFDPLSAFIGAVVAFFLSIVIYTFRDVLGRVWQALVAWLGRLRHRIEASADERYREQVIAWAHSRVIPARAAPLDAIFIMPRLRTPWPIPPSISKTEQVDTAPQTSPLHQLLEGHPRLLILGGPGSGRTTTLAYLALVCARMSKKALDHPSDSEIPASIARRLPLYIPLPVMDWNEDVPADETEQEGKPQEKGSKATALGKLLATAVAAMGGGGGLNSVLEKALKSGQAIVLVDGWDALLPQQRQQAALWLAELTGTLPGNLWLVTTGPEDYAPLTDTGFIPLHLTAWDTMQVETLANHWMEAHKADGSPAVSSYDLADELKRATRKGALPMELAMRAFVALSEGKPPAKRAALFDRALELILSLHQEQEQDEEPWLPAACRTVLGQIALSLQQEERAAIGRGEIESAVEAVLPPPEERHARAVARVLNTLTGEHGLLRPAGPNLYAFSHPLWQAYLAARQLVAAAPTQLLSRLEDPHWSDVLRFYAELGDMQPLVSAWLQIPDDIFHTRLCTLSTWVSAAPDDAAWRSGAMAVMARTLLQTSPPAPVRQALARALAATGLSGVAYFFKQALQHPDPTLRSAAVTGLADVAGESDVPLFDTCLQDENPAVREAAVRALASLGIDAAKRQLERVLTEGEDTLRPVAAEVYAMCGEKCVAFLRETAGSEDMMTRRAAVFGLARAGERGLLERLAREDDQWIVRSAAVTALEELDARSKSPGIAPIPEIEQLPWLISWAASRGEGVGTGEAAGQKVRQALSEGDAPVRLAAALVLAQTGRPDDVELLLGALADPDPIVAGMVFEALAEVARRYRLTINRTSQQPG